MQPRRILTEPQTIVVPRPHPDSLAREEIITIDLSVEAAAALGPDHTPHTVGELPDDLRGMYYTG